MMFDGKKKRRRGPSLKRGFAERPESLKKAKRIMKLNPLKQLSALGQSIWLDYIRRDLIASGRLKRMIEEDGLLGMTSNPAIFEKAFSSSQDYDHDIETLARTGKKAQDIYDAISIAEVQNAADVFKPVYEQTQGKDGYVSLEVSPHLARDTEGTLAEARRLWKALNRPNVMIKVPGTDEGLPVIRRLIAEGVNVNVTLLFGLDRYREVAEAFITGLEERSSQGRSPKNVASVASFFVSRIDTLVDPMLEKIMSEGGPRGEKAKQAHGQVAVACAKEAYQIFKDLFGNDRFKKLAGQGAQRQRLLWASTGTKNPAYSDVKYVEELIGPDTVDTAPMETIDAYRDHGDPKVRLENDLDQARAVLANLPELGIDIDKVTEQLVNEAVEKFDKPFDKLIETLSKTISGYSKAAS